MKVSDCVVGPKTPSFQYSSKCILYVQFLKTGWLLSHLRGRLWLLCVVKIFTLELLVELIFIAVALLPGTLLPRLPSEPGMTLLTIRIEKIGLKDAGQCIDPYITVSVKGK